MEYHNDDKHLAENRVERLRRFLSFRLAIDYRLLFETPDKITREDFCHFANLARECFLPTLTQERQPIKWSHLSYLEPRDIVIDDILIQEHMQSRWAYRLRWLWLCYDSSSLLYALFLLHGSGTTLEYSI